MTKRVAGLIWCASLIGVLTASTFCCAATTRESESTSRLVALAAAQFPDLTKAERALLVFVELKNRAQGDFALGGPSAVPNDPINDPAHADRWDHERDVRAELIRWLCVDPDASRLVDPQGIRLLGARITGRLNLSRVHVPFPIVLRNCLVPERITLVATSISSLDLGGSHISEMDAPGIEVESDLGLGSGFQAAGEINLAGAQVGDLEALGGHFKSSAVDRDLFDPKNTDRRAFYGPHMRVRGNVDFHDVQAEGCVFLFGSTIGTDLILDGHFVNPGKTAINAGSTDVGENVIIGLKEPFASDGVVSFIGARVGNSFAVIAGTFSGAAREPHGLDAQGMSVKTIFLWTNVALPNGGFLKLSGASTAALADDERSWPAPGNLQIDGFTYTAIIVSFSTSAPGDASTRLRWLKRQRGFHPQPYRQLAKVLREGGDQAGATQVLIASDDLDHRRFGLPGRIWGALLNATIGYGHRPLRAIFWSGGVVLFGWMVVGAAKRARVMRLTWPETTPPPSGDSMAGLHPLLYSLDTFLPFVNLHQEHYWWPDEFATGTFPIWARDFRVSGAMVRYYLWLQIIAGWLLSAIFIAGVTGLIRND